MPLRAELLRQPLARELAAMLPRPSAVRWWMPVSNDYGFYLEDNGVLHRAEPEHLARATNITQLSLPQPKIFNHDCHRRAISIRRLPMLAPPRPRLPVK